MNPGLSFISSSGSVELGDLLFEFSNLSLQVLNIVAPPDATQAAPFTKESRAAGNHDNQEDKTDYREDPPPTPHVRSPRPTHLSLLLSSTYA